MRNCKVHRSNLSKYLCWSLPSPAPATSPDLDSAFPSFGDGDGEMRGRERVGEEEGEEGTSGSSFHGVLSS